jgi:hypothetical protein
VAGTSHAAEGRPCADACEVAVFGAPRRDVTLAAVAADGAGSAARGEEGARLACGAVIDRARRALPEALCSEELKRFDAPRAMPFVTAVRERIDAAARSEGRPRGDFACTLLVALVGERAAAFLQVGDGAIVYRGDRGDYVPAHWPAQGEYANCTSFVTEDRVSERLQAVGVEGVHEVALLTDGLQALALRYAQRAVHGPFFEPMFDRLRRERARVRRGLARELRAFLDSPAVNARTDDDKTLVLATRLPAAGRRPTRAS